MTDIESARFSLEGGSDLQMPPLPRGLLKVLAPLHESGFADQEVVFAAVDCEPSLEDRLLNYLNAQFRRQTSDLERAVQMVGPTTTAGLIIGLSLRKWKALRDGPAGACLLRLIYHSEATAALTQQLLSETSSEGGELSNGDREQSLMWRGFAAGFVHDVGKLALIYNYPEKASTLYRPQRTDTGYENADPRAVEHGVFGCDHVEAGARVAAALDLPAPLAAAVERHHDDEALASTGAEDVRAVRAANLLTKTMNTEVAGISATQATLDWETCASDSIWSGVLDGGASSLKTVKENFTDELVLYTRFFLDLPDVQRLSRIDR